ncbi:hypothetical protein HN51_061459 [Arachis hypogaea]
MGLSSDSEQVPKPARSGEYASTPISRNTSAHLLSVVGAEEDSQAKQLPQKEINLPRRFSKRLAGIQLDPVPELVTRSRAVRGAAKSENAANMSKSTKLSTPESSSQPRIEIRLPFPVQCFVNHHLAHSTPQIAAGMPQTFQTPQTKENTTEDATAPGRAAKAGQHQADEHPAETGLRKQQRKARRER